MSQSMVQVARYDDLFEAHLGLGLLEEHGIHGFLADENLSTLAWHFTRAIGGVKLFVRGEDVQEAEKVLDREAEEAALKRRFETPEERQARILKESPRKAYLSAMFGILFPPLAAWALFLATDVLRARRFRELDPISRSQIAWAIGMGVFGISLLLLMLWAIFLQ